MRAAKVRVMSGIRQCLGGLTLVCQMIQNLFDVRRILYSGDDPDSLFVLLTSCYIDLDDTVSTVEDHLAFLNVRRK